MRESSWTMTLENERLKRLLRPASRRAFQTLSWIENRIWANVRLAYSPVFIVAPPRAGTTLLYQLMTGCLSTSYFTNMAMRMHVQDSPVAPIIGANLVKWFRLGRNSSETFESYYGATKGLGGPHEGNWVWSQWFPEEVHYVPPGVLSAEARRGLYRAVAGTERVFDRPFVNKRIRNAVRIEALAEIFPTALFIQCMRNPLDIAQSIHVAQTRDFPFQRNTKQAPTGWWASVRPKEYETIKDKGFLEQICEQVFFIERNIAEAREALGEERFLQVDYRDVCQTPRPVVGSIVAFMNAHNAPTQIIRAIPDAFPYSTGRKIDHDDYVELASCLNHLYGRSMD